MSGAWGRLVATGLLASGAWFVAPSPASAQVGEDEPMLRIIGGAPARAGVWPSMVRLDIARRHQGGIGRFRCGGTIIGRDWALTAAHCIVDGAGNRAILGQSFVIEGTTEAAPGRGRRIAIAEIIPHPAYATAGGIRNDIALLRLAEPSEQPRQKLLAAVDRAAALPAGRMTTVIGFGRTDLNNETSTADRLMQVDVPLVSNRQCQNDYAALGARPASFGDFAICAGFREGGRDSCQGDSGGPLFAPTGTGAAQVGVVSWGTRRCATARAPAVYASVGHFEPWIRRHVPDADFTARSNAPAPPSPNPGPAPAPRPAEVTDARCFAAFETPPEVPPSQTAQLTIDIVQGNRLRIGTAATFRIQGSVEGSLMVFAVNPAGEVVVLFPNPRIGGFMPGQATRRMVPGQTMLLPGPADGFRAVVQPPAGPGVVCAALLPVTPQTRALIEQTPALTPIADRAGFRARLDAAVRSARQADPGGGRAQAALASRLFEVVP